MEEGAPPSAPVLPGPGPSRPDSGRPRQSTVIGGFLVVIGAAFLIGQIVHVDVGHYGWPFVIIIPGVVLLLIALTSRGFFSEGLAILGSITATTGLILLVQNSTDHFSSWAYAWALIFPGAVGVGMIVYGLVQRRPGNVRAGIRLLGIGVILFLLGAAFFEGVLWGGYELGRSTGAVIGALIVGLGALLLIRNVTSGRRGSA